MRRLSAVCQLTLVNRMNVMKMKLINHQLGATLLESLIALVVFSVGALGIAALQTTTLVRSDDVKQRSLAIWKAQELADRIKASGSLDDPDGLATDYIDEVGAETLDQIGVFDLNSTYTCPAEPTRCDDTDGNAVGICTADELVSFDVWSVLCDPVNGATATTLGANDGENKLKNLDVALFEGADANEGEYFLYFEWLSRSAEQDQDLQAAAATVTSNLCGTDLDVDSRLSVYCLRFR